MIRILFIDDDPQAQKTLKMVLDPDYLLTSAYAGSRGIDMVVSEDPDVVLLDINLPDRGGLEVLRRIVEMPLAPPVVMLTVEADIPTVVHAMRLGATDYIVKPYQLPQLQDVLRRAVLDRERSRDPELGAHPALARILGHSPAISRVRDLVQRFAVAGYPVTITGESGTGKELVARALHALSNRAGSFVALNCGAVPETLVEAELFGTERGAFTDARSRAGLFEQADGGTLFLDEIGELPLASQAKLLRVLEEKEISRLGASGRRTVDVRVVSATARPLDAESGVLRRDLFYRIGVLNIEIAPLRERPEDIPLLAQTLATDHGCCLAQAAVEQLLSHPWPGNVRELKNVLARAAVLCEGGRIEARDIHLR